jgi:hypothetical protein
MVGAQVLLAPSLTMKKVINEEELEWSKKGGWGFSKCPIKHSTQKLMFNLDSRSILSAPTNN